MNEELLDSLELLRKEESFLTFVDRDEDGQAVFHDISFTRASKYLTLLPETSVATEEINIASVEALEKARKILSDGAPIQTILYCIPYNCTAIKAEMAV